MDRPCDRDSKSNIGRFTTTSHSVFSAPKEKMANMALKRNGSKVVTTTSTGIKKWVRVSKKMS
jgi:hypothetical protein